MINQLRQQVSAFVLLISISLTACLAGSSLPYVTKSPRPVATITSSSTPSVQYIPKTATPTTLSTPTAVTESLQPHSTESISSALRFVFPTPGPAPKSAWRPPLYDVPWALTPNDHFYFARPIAVDEVNWPLADYRYGATWPGKPEVIHTGVDIDAPLGTAVLAAGPGEVVWVGFGLSTGTTNLDDPYGLAIAIKHDFGYNGERLESVYAHLSESDVVLGQMVKTGEKIGLVGDTGMTTGPHLHFEIRVEYSNYYYTTRNPELWLVPPQGWGLLVGHIMQNSWTPLYSQDVYIKSMANGDNWLVRTYAQSSSLFKDDYYDEDLVLSDLPAGDYEVALKYKASPYSQVITIHPGMVTYLSYSIADQFSTALPTPVQADFLSSPAPTKKTQSNH